MKRILSLFLTLLLVFSLTACTQSLRSVDETSEAIAAPTTEPVQPDEVTLDFCGHTDFLGNLQQSDAAPGAAILAAVETALQAKNPEGSFFFALGDALSGTPIAALVEGRSVVETFNAMSYDAFTLGNHEFDWGPQVLEQTLSEMRCPVLCANILDSATGEPLKGTVPYVILEKNGVKVGVLGLTTEATPTIIRAEYAAALTIADTTETAAKYVPEMRDAGAEIVIIAGHLPLYLEEGATEYSGELWDIANQVDGIDAIFGGHNDTLNTAEKINGIPVAKSSFYGNELSHIAITYDRTNKTVVGSTCENISVTDAAASLTADTAVADIVAKYATEVDLIFDEAIGTAAEDCEVDYFYECSIGNWFSNAVKDATGADMAFINLSGIFESVPAGEITLRKLYQMSPFENELVVAEITGAQLHELWETTLETERMPQYGSLAFAGLRITYDSNAADGSKVQALARLDGSEIEDGDTFTIATLDFLAGGGNDYALLPQLNWHGTAIMMRDAYADAMRTMGTLTADTTGWMVDIRR